MIIKNYKNNPPEIKVDKIAVALGVTNFKKKLLHTGFYYKDENEEVRFLHLGWDKYLLKTYPTQKYIWIDLHVSDLTSDLISVFCDLVYKQNKNTIPYALEFGQSSFQSSGSYTFTEGEGLTCATFVMKLLQKYRIKVVDQDHWPLYPSDKTKLYCLLEKLNDHFGEYKLYKYFCDKIESGLVRFSPEEIVACAGKEGYPHKRDDIQDEALLLRQEAINAYSF